MAFWLGAWIGCIIVSWIIGSEKNRAADGFILGVFLGFLGIIAIICMKPIPVENKDTQSTLE